MKQQHQQQKTTKLTTEKLNIFSINKLKIFLRNKKETILLDQ